MIKEKKRMMIAVNYNQEQNTRVKTFCGIIGKSLADFTAEALDNEIAEKIESMEPDKQKAVKQILGVE